MSLDLEHVYSINHNYGMVNEATALGLVRSANAGPGMVQSTEEPATQIQGESVILERLVARVREMGLSRPD
jgi:hypothetical protein